MKQELKDLIDRMIENNEDISVFLNGKDYFAKMYIANEGIALDILIRDRSPWVRAAVARQGYKLDKLLNDSSWYVRQEATNKETRLDKLEKMMADPSEFVRAVVAAKGVGLDKLINDESGNVRYWVALNGYGLDRLIKDADYRVVSGVYEWLRDNEMTIEEYKEKYPEKCVDMKLDDKIKTVENKRDSIDSRFRSKTTERNFVKQNIEMSSQAR